MYKTFLFLSLVFLAKCHGALRSSDDELKTERPIIGILAQEQSFYLSGKYPEENYTSYIAASYVKDVESAGARVVPIMIGRDREYYRDLMSKINGVLMPGGATYFNQSNGYADAGQHIYEIAIEMNEAGDYFPIFGTCLGFELLLILASGRGEPENRIRCYSYGNLPLNFVPEFRQSKTYRDAPEEIISLLANENVLVYAHQFCIVDENMDAFNLTDDWLVTSYQDDADGVKFIASVEHKRYPFYGVQFHPEKSAFEWKLSKGYPHSIEAVMANRYFMDFFVRETRKSGHSFATIAEENAVAIYNHRALFTGVIGSAHHEIYFFEPKGVVPCDE